MDNYQQVLVQMAQFGIELREGKDLPLKLDTRKSVTCGKGGKDWYKLYLFRRDPDKGGGTYVVGTFGTYRHGGASQKVEVERGVRAGLRSCGRSVHGLRPSAGQRLPTRWPRPSMCGAGA